MDKGKERHRDIGRGRIKENFQHMCTIHTQILVTAGWMDGWMDGWTDRRVNGWWVDG